MKQSDYLVDFVDSKFSEPHVQKNRENMFATIKHHKEEMIPASNAGISNSNSLNFRDARSFDAAAHRSGATDDGLAPQRQNSKSAAADVLI